MVEPQADLVRRKPAQRRSRDTVGAILEATARVLVTEGAAGASTNRIAKVAGVGIGTLYQYFANRDEILRALGLQHAAEMTQLLAAHAGPLGDAPPEVAVPAFIDALAAAHAHAPRLHIALVETMLANGAGMYKLTHDPGRMLVRAWLESQRDRIRPRDLDAAASLLTCTVEAAIHSQIIEDPERLTDPAWRAELVDLVLRYLVA